MTLAAVASLVACGGNAVTPEHARRLLEGIGPEGQARLSGRTVYFGHQSVGYNITKGIEDLVQSYPKLGVRLVETRDAAAMAGPCFAHSKNGENKKPLVKIQAFEQALDAGIGGHADIAFFKFCYIDFTPQTDLEQLFADYKATMARLQERFPTTQIVHMTVPLTTVEAGPKAWAKTVLRRPLAGVRENVVRSRFNDMLRAEYDGKEPLFDLAKVESTYPDGTRKTFRRDGAEYPALIAAYASDGRHLNAEGGQWIAAHLLSFLATLPEPRASAHVGPSQVPDRRGGA
jgi:hypothetical protein